jgi:[ribosomal protein S5]-alanine N-acetyltransferase
VIGAETTRLVVPDLPEAAPDGVLIMRGRRVNLRTLTRGDLAHLAEWVDDPYLERMVGSDLLHAFKHQYDKGPEFYDACLTDPTQVVLIIVPAGGARPVGLVRLFNIHLLEGYAFLETIVADRRAMRRGFGIEAGRLIAAYGLDVLGLHRIEAKVYAYNVLSMNALRRNGFQQEGVLREAGFDGQRYWDVLVFGILREEMEEQRKRDGVGLPFDGADGTVRDPA